VNMGNKESGKLVWLQMPESARFKLVKQIKEKLRERILEAKVWRELLQVDDLTINGTVVWKENQQSSVSSIKYEKRR
jgi:hypothetical protein